MTAKEALKVVSEAISGRTPKERAQEAINVVLANYETQLLIFMVGVAKARVTRVFRATELLDSLEGELFKQERIQSMTTGELLKTWQVANAAASESLDYIKQVLSMRAELERLGAATRLDATLQKVLNGELSGLPTISPKERERVRALLSRVVNVSAETE